MSINSEQLNALKDDKLVHVDTVPTGLKCGCICSKCKGLLVAKNGGKIEAHHLVHHKDSNCSLVTHKKFNFSKNFQI